MAKESSPVTKSQRAFSLIEILLSIALFGLFVTAIVGALIYGRETTMVAGQRSRAAMLCNEGLEAVRNIRDAAWANLVDGNYGLSTAGGIFSFLGTQDTNDIFTRQINISTIDADTKGVTSTITWQQTPQRPGTMVCSSRFSNWRATYVPPCPWGLVVEESYLDLVTNSVAVKVQLQGNYAYVIKDGNGGNNFFVVNITNTTAPVISGILNLSGRPRNIYVSGNYAYVASGDNSQELQIVNITNPAAPVLAGSLNLSGNADANGIWYNGLGYVYLARTSSTAPEFYVINVTNPAAPAITGSLELGTGANDVASWGSYAYVATNANPQEVRIINITNPAAPTITSIVDLPGNTNAFSVSGYPNILYVGRTLDFWSIDVSNPAAPVALDSLTIGADVTDIALNFYPGNTLAFLATYRNLQDFQVVNIANPADLSVCVTFNPQYALYGVAYDVARDRVVIVGNSNLDEFKILRPGP